MKKSKWLDCQGNEFFPKQKGTPLLVKIEHKNTATLDSARSNKKSKVAVLQLDMMLMIGCLLLAARLVNFWQHSCLHPIDIPVDFFPVY